MIRPAFGRIGGVNIGGLSRVQPSICILTKSSDQNDIGQATETKITWQAVELNIGDAFTPDLSNNRIYVNRNIDLYAIVTFPWDQQQNGGTRTTRLFKNGSIDPEEADDGNASDGSLSQQTGTVWPNLTYVPADYLETYVIVNAGTLCDINGSGTTNTSQDARFMLVEIP